MDIVRFVRERAADHECPLCDARLGGAEVNLLGEEEGVFTLRLTCPRCSIQLVVVLHTDVDDDLVPAQGPQQPWHPPISADEVLDVHEFLRGWRGPLTELAGATEAG